MEEETIKAIEDPLYWSTDKIINLNDPAYQWVSRARYDALLRKFNTQEQAYKELSKKYGEQRHDLFELKDAVKIILKHYN